MSFSDADTEFCNVLCAWQKLEEGLKGDTIIDFNLMELEGNGRTYDTRESVSNDLNQLLSSDETQTDRYFYQRIYGLRAYLMDVMNNQETPYDEYLQATMGLQLTYLPDAYLDDLQRNLKETLAALGVDFNDALDSLASKTSNIPIAQIPDWFHERYEPSLDQAEQVFGVRPEIPQPIVSIYSKDSPARAYISVKGLQLSVEFNDQQVKDDTEERLLGTYNHEVLGHGINAVMLVDAINDGRIARHNSLTTMQGIEAFQMEGLAESASKYFGDSVNKLYQASVELAFYGRQVTNNFHYLISRPNPDMESAVVYHKDMLPYRDDKFIKARIGMIQGDNSLQRAYYPIYPSAMRLYCHAIENLSPDDQKEFMKQTYSRLMDATDLYELALSMGVPELDNFTPTRPDVVNQIERQTSKPAALNRALTPSF